MSRNNRFRTLVICIAALALLACKKEKADVAEDIGTKADPLAMEAELNILALNGRIESGKNNPDIDWVSPFVNATGCKVKATLAPDNLSLVSSLANQAVDLVISTESIPSELTQSIDISRLRSYKDVDKRFLASTSVKQILALPFQWQMLKPEPPATEMSVQLESTQLHAKAKNINCAYAWMEWSLSPKVQGDIASALGTIPVIPAACVGNEALGDDACKQRMSEVIDVETTEAPAEVPADSKAP